MLFDLNDVTKRSNVTGNELEKAVDGITKNNNFHGLGNYFVEAEKKYSVNAVILTAMCCNESKFVTSELAKTKNNLFGIGARDELKGTSEYGNSYISKKDSIFEAAHRIGCQYLKRDSKASWRYLGGAKDWKSVRSKWSTSKDYNSKIANLAERLEKEIYKSRNKNDYKELYEKEKEKNKVLEKTLEEIKEMIEGIKNDMA